MHEGCLIGLSGTLARNEQSECAVVGSVVQNHDGVWIAGCARNIGACSVLEISKDHGERDGMQNFLKYQRTMVKEMECKIRQEKLPTSKIIMVKKLLLLKIYIM